MHLSPFFAMYGQPGIPWDFFLLTFFLTGIAKTPLNKKQRDCIPETFKMSNIVTYEFESIFLPVISSPITLAKTTLK